LGILRFATLHVMHTNLCLPRAWRRPASLLIHFDLDSVPRLFEVTICFTHILSSLFFEALKPADMKARIDRSLTLSLAARELGLVARAPHRELPGIPLIRN
jgi:hypothetical protein